ncbi:MAG: hypothetical protein M1366_04085 [Patescibacteria group bacterium]|nr:hypothetical protein [Patescibacteria group bacterium]
MIKKIFLFLLAFLCGILVTITIYSFFAKKTQTTLSPQTFYLTQPVTSFSGKVDAVEGNTIQANQTLYLQIPNSVAPSPGQLPAAFTAGSAKTVTYRITVDQNTKIERSYNPVVYFFKKITPAPAPRITLSDIKPGQTITAYSAVDLRTVQSAFTASLIQIPPVPTSITGAIVDRSGSQLTIQSYLGFLSPPKNKSFTLSVTPDTEISTADTSFDPSKPAQPRLLHLSDLMPGMQINVYTDQDITTTDHLTALRIEPLLSNPLPLLGTSSSPQSTPSATSSVPTVPTATTQLSTSR